MSQSVDQDDMRHLQATILEEMRAGFAGVHRRQDVTNGRVTKGELIAARLDERVKVLGRRFNTVLAVINRRRKARREADTMDENGLSTYAARKYPMKVVVPSVAAATIAVVEALQRIVPAVLELFK